MKYLFLILPFFGFSQQQFWNTNCQTAKFLCENDFGDTLLNITQPNCPGGFDVYYYYRTEPNGVSGNAIQFSTTSSSGYELFGPFKNMSDGYDSLITSKRINYSSTNGTSHSASYSGGTVTASDQFYILKIHFTTCTAGLQLMVSSGFRVHLSNSWIENECVGCIPAFRPSAGTYVISAWARDNDALEINSTVSFSQPYLQITSGATNLTVYPSGDIIDGWQRIQDTVVVAEGDFNLSFGCGDGDCYFDDIRIFPKDGSMVSYVYDPLTFRLMAELDDNNYAKFYEYDEDGKLIRVKKETERGIMTIQESRENNSKR